MYPTMAAEAPDQLIYREPGCERGEIEQELDRLSEAAGQTEKLLSLLRQRLQPVLADHGTPPNRTSTREASISKTPSSSLGCRLQEARQHLAGQNDVISELLHTICL